MKMGTRSAKLAAGTLKPKEQARAEREARKNGSEAQTTTQGSIQPVVFDEKTADDRFHAKFLGGYLAKNITQQELEQAKSKGRPPEVKMQRGEVQSTDEQGGAAGGGTPASTQPGDYGQNSGWTRKGPDLK